MPRSSVVPTVAMLTIVLSACTSGQSSLDASPSAIAQDASAECPGVAVRGPDGAAPNLSGTWIGIGERGATPWPGTYEFNLLNSCLAWVGRSAEEGEEVGAGWMNVFLGKVNPDFTISGDWAVVSRSDPCETGSVAFALCNARGTLILRIDWPDPADTSRVRLVLQEATKIGLGGGIGDFVTGIWVRPGDEALFDVPVE